MNYLLIIFFFLVIYYIYKKFFVPLNYWKDLGVPYVKPYPFLGNILELFTKKISFIEWLQNMYNAHEDARYIGCHQLWMPTLIIKDLELIKNITIKEFDKLPNRSRIVTEEWEPIFGKSLSSLHDERWKQMRATLSPTFTGSKMRVIFNLMKECTERFIKHFEEKIGENETLTLELKETLGRYATDVIASTAFGMQCDSLKDRDNEFFLMGKEITSFNSNVFYKIIGYNYIPHIMNYFNIRIFSLELCNFFYSIISNNIKYREENGIVRPDMIHLMLEARKGKLKHDEDLKNKDNQTGFATVEESEIGKDSKHAITDLTDESITSQAVLFFIAGFDTISNAMCHMVYELAINVDIQEKLQEEIDDAFKSCNGDIKYEVLMKLKYLDMVVSESLRKWPGTGWFDRICTTESYTIPAEPGEKTITLQKNVPIFFPIYAIHRDPKNYPNPDKFDPERFNDENKKNIKPFSYVPFGSGPRNCIGSRYALMEIKLMMLYLFSNFNAVLVEKSVVPLKLAKSSFSMMPDSGFWLGLQRRKK